jgi:hypothetical protein
MRRPPPAPSGLDAYRDLMSAFPTGVAVIIAVGPAGAGCTG